MKNPPRLHPLLAAALLGLALTAPAQAAVRGAEGIGLYVAVDGLATLSSGTYAGLVNPNAGRLTLLFDHGDHFHGIGAYSYTGPVGSPVVAGTNTNNRLPELHTRVDEATSAIPLVPGSGAWAGSWVSSVLPESAPTHEYSLLGTASVQSLSGLGSAGQTLYASSGNRWSGVYSGVSVALRLDAVTPGLKIGVGDDTDVFEGGAGSLFVLGDSANFTFMPVFHVDGSAAVPGTYTAQFSLVNVGSNSAVLDGGTFFYDFAVPAPVPEPQTWALMAAGGALLVTRLKRNRRR